MYIMQVLCIYQVVLLDHGTEYNVSLEQKPKEGVLEKKYTQNLGVGVYEVLLIAKIPPYFSMS